MPTGRRADEPFEVGARVQPPQPGPTATTRARSMQQTPGNPAGQAAIHLAKYADRMAMVVRGGGLAASMSDYLVKTIEATANIDVHLHTTVIDAHGTDRLEELVLRDAASGRTRTVPAAALFVLIGAQPHTDWLPAEILRPVPMSPSPQDACRARPGGRERRPGPNPAGFCANWVVTASVGAGRRTTVPDAASDRAADQAADHAADPS